MADRVRPSRQSQRHSRNLEHLKRVQMTGGNHGRSNGAVFASLHATQLVGSQQKAFLPAELIACVLDYLPPADLLRCARASHMLQEMVYEDARWVQKLKAMRAWNEVEARQRVEEAMKRKAEVAKMREGERPGSVHRASQSIGGDKAQTASITLFDAGQETERLKKTLDSPASKRRAADGFDTHPASISSSLTKALDPSSAIHVFDRVRSIRGHARQEFGKVYDALGPLYYNLTTSVNHADALLFRTYHDPDQQARVLANMKRFAQCDCAAGAYDRERRLDDMIRLFEQAVLQEFEQGCAADDVEGRMHRYAHVLFALNGGASGRDAFIAFNPIVSGTLRLGKPLDCLEAVAPGHVDLNPSQAFFERLAGHLVKQAAIIDKVFPPTLDVFTPLLSRICEGTINDYLTALLDEAHERGNETYVKAVAGTFAQALRLVASLTSTKASPADFAASAKAIVIRCYDRHIDLYLTEELDLFRTKSEEVVGRWEKDLSDQEASTESFFMSNISRQAAKRDFLSSFKKVVMMPVNALPAIPLSSPFASARPTSVVARSSAAHVDTLDSLSTARARSASASGSSTPPFRPGTPAQEPPTTELAAKAAIMKSRLEGIKSLFSIDVAISLTHLAKASIERIGLMVQMGGTAGTASREQCGAIFVKLLDILGNRHVRNGFEKAVGHLGNYNPREVRRFREQSQSGEGVSETTHGGVEPLVTFLELVNIGDLIQQMIDVFYVQELVGPKLADRDDFLDPTVKEKRKFEQMLDEKVAAGLNKGIDVLMDEVEFICATNQSPSDFNPPSTSTDSGIVDIGPSATAKQVVAMVSGHTGMLVGSTDKNMLDVFTQEVGLRLFGVLCKHFKRQRISVAGAIILISDINHYAAFIATLRQKPLLPYYQALREMSQIYLVHIDPPAAYFGGGSAGAKGAKRGSILSTKSSPTALQAKELATIIADTQRYHGIFPAEEVYEFAERRADWYLVKGDVERAMYGVGCVLM